MPRRTELLDPRNRATTDLGCSDRTGHLEVVWAEGFLDITAPLLMACLSRRPGDVTHPLFPLDWSQVFIPTPADVRLAREQSEAIF